MDGRRAAIDYAVIAKHEGVGISVTGRKNMGVRNSR